MRTLKDIAFFRADDPDTNVGPTKFLITEIEPGYAVVSFYGTDELADIIDAILGRWEKRWDSVKDIILMKLDYMDLDKVTFTGVSFGAGMAQYAEEVTRDRFMSKGIQVDAFLFFPIKAFIRIKKKFKAVVLKWDIVSQIPFRSSQEFEIVQLVDHPYKRWQKLKIHRHLVEWSKK